MAGVHIGRGLHHQQFAALGNVHTTHHRVSGGLAAPGHDGAGHAQALFHRVGNQRRVGTHRLPGRAVLQQREHGVGAGFGGGFVRSGQDGHHHGAQVRLGDDLRVQLVLGNGVVHPALAIGLGQHAVQNVLRHLPKAAHVVGQGLLLLGAGPAPGVDRVGHAKAAQLFGARVRHTQKFQRNVQRNVVEHLAHQVGPALVHKTVHVLAGELAHHGLKVHQALGQKGVHQQAPACHVLGLVLVDHGALHGKAVALQNLRHLGRGGRDFLQRNGGRKQDVVAEHGLDVFVAADHPVAQLGAPKHRFLLARPAQVLARGSHVVRLKRVESGGLGTQRAACRCQGKVVHRAA